MPSVGEDAQTRDPAGRTHTVNDDATSRRGHRPPRRGSHLARHQVVGAGPAVLPLAGRAGHPPGMRRRHHPGSTLATDGGGARGHCGLVAGRGEDGRLEPATCAVGAPVARIELDRPGGSDHRRDRQRSAEPACRADRPARGVRRSAADVRALPGPSVVGRPGGGDRRRDGSLVCRHGRHAGRAHLRGVGVVVERAVAPRCDLRFSSSTLLRSRWGLACPAPSRYTRTSAHCEASFARARGAAPSRVWLGFW